MSFRNAVSPGPSGSGVPETAAQGYSIIDAQSTVDGTLRTSDDLRVEGIVLGTVECAGVLYVAEGAQIDATIDAGGIIVAGSLSGVIRCHGRMEIRSSGIVRGQVETERLMILEGGVYEGQLRMDAPSPPNVSVPEEPEATEFPQIVEPEPTPEPPTAYSFLRNFTTTQTVAEPSTSDLPGSGSDDEPN